MNEKEQCRPRLSPEEFDVVKAFRDGNVTVHKEEDRKEKRYLVLGCVHVPFHNKKIFEGVLNLMEDQKFDGLVLAGDFLDMGALSTYERGKISRTGVTLEDEYNAGNEVLDALEARLPSWASKVFMFGNHCFDKETSLLSEDGWVGIEDLSMDKKYASYNEEKDCIEYDYPLDVIKYQYDGEMHRYLNKSIDLMVTPKHRMYGRPKGKNSKYRFVLSEDIKDKSYNFKLAVENKNEEYPISDNEIKFAAWIHTDGSLYNSKNGASYRIYQSKPDEVNQIRNLLDDMGLEYSENVRSRDIKIVDGKTLKKQPLDAHEFYIFKEQINGLVTERKVFDEWVYKLSARQFDLFLDGLILGDGSRFNDGRESTMIYGYKEFLEQIQNLCFMNGRGTSIYTYRGNQYKLNIPVRKTESACNSVTKDVETVNYSGTIGCITTKNGTVVCRRNNKISIQGNCARYWKWKSDVDNDKYGDVLNPIKALDLEKRDYKVYSDYTNDYHNLGSLVVMHGEYFNIHCAKKHLDVFRRNVLFFHTHRMQMYREGDFAGYNGGFLGDKKSVAFNYANRGMKSAWANGFSVVTLDEDENHHVELIGCVKDKFTYNGKTYGG